jgi:hypothetical protein
VAKSLYTKGDPPSAWSIVLVVGLLILLPSLFCTGVWLTMSHEQPKTTGGLKIERPKDAGGP